MNINKNNYEAFFLDYHEGNLSPLQVADLLLFVEQHPELREEFESFENVTLDDLSTISFGDKSSLKKEININNKDEYFIRSIENILTTEEKGLVENFIKQHPQYLPEFELFQKTKLSADTSIVFENKEFLKRSLSPALSKGEGVVPELQKWNDLLIASIEGLLSKQETTLLDQQISVDAEMQHNYNLYKKTKLVADVSVVYENKEELKRKERKIIPFYYYVAAAASTLLLVGLFFIYKGKNTVDQNFADKNNRIETIQKESNGTSNEVIKANEVIKNSSITPIQTAAVLKNKKENSVKNNISVDPVVTVNEEQKTNIAEIKKENSIEKAPNNEVLVIQQPIINNQQLPALAINTEKKNTNRTGTEYLSLKELAAEKIKEKTLDDQTLAMQKKNGRAKRFTGWDLAQIVTKGISKITGRDVEVKPTYNDEGDVTAYALGGGFQVSRGK